MKSSFSFLSHNKEIKDPRGRQLENHHEINSNFYNNLSLRGSYCLLSPPTRFKDVIRQEGKRQLRPLVQSHPEHGLENPGSASDGSSVSQDHPVPQRMAEGSPAVLTSQGKEEAAFPALCQRYPAPLTQAWQGSWLVTICTAERGASPQSQRLKDQRKRPRGLRGLRGGSQPLPVASLKGLFHSRLRERPLYSKRGN